jgi:hypothetical protein
LASIDIGTVYENWIKENVVPVFNKNDVGVTRSAQLLLAYALQIQVDEKFVSDEKTLFTQAEELLKVIPTVYRWQYGKQPMNFNRALHALVYANQIRLAFPWTPSI